MRSSLIAGLTRLNTLLLNASIPATGLNLIAQGFSEDLLRQGYPSLSESSRIGSALALIGILGPCDLLISYQDISPWHRGGAETFISEFEVSFCTALGELRAIRIVAKAIAAWGRVPDLVARDWKLRQDYLQDGGINIPTYYGYWQGIFLQMYIPFSFVDYFHGLEPHSREIWCRKLLDLAAKIDRLGFQPIALVEDLRTDGTKLYVVDLGEDLGGAGHRAQLQATNLVTRWISSRIFK